MTAQTNRSLTNDLQLAFNRCLGFSIPLEGLKRKTYRESLNCLNGIENIAE